MPAPAYAIPTNMKIYTLAFLRPGPRYDELSDKTKPENAALQAAHLNDVRANIEAGVQIMAAPILDAGADARVSAIAVFVDALSLEDAATLLAKDPAIAAGRFIFEVHKAFFPSLDTVHVTY